MELIFQGLRETSSFVLLAWKNFLSGNNHKRSRIVDLFLMFSYGAGFIYLGFLSGADADIVNHTWNLIFWSLGFASVLIWATVVPVVVYLIDHGIPDNQWKPWKRWIPIDSATDVVAVPVPINWKPTQDQIIVIERSKIVIDAILRINNNYIINLFLFWLSDPMVRRGLHDYYDRQGYSVTFSEVDPGNYFFLSLNKLRDLRKPIPRNDVSKTETQEEASEPVKAKTLAATTGKPVSNAVL